MIVAAGVLLIVALGVFLAVARFRNPLNLKELPKRLGVDIEQEVNGVTYSHSLGAHSQFKIQASRAEQLKDGRILLHSVKIELYGQDGNRVDRIEGKEFNYDQKSGTATAVGPVEITLMRPGVAPAIAPKATTDRAVNNKAVPKPLASAAQQAASGEIHVETSGLSSNWNTGVTTTAERVNFTMKQGSGSALGATFDSQQGILVLNSDVDLTTHRGSETVHIHAGHAEFVRDEQQCYLRDAVADYRAGRASAADAKVLFRDDGSAEHLDASNGFTLTTPTGGRLEAPTGWLDFDEHSQPRRGHLEGGVRMESVSTGRRIRGASPRVELEFSTRGQLRHAHLERGVEMHSETETQTAANPKTGTPSVQVRTARTWHSQVADINFRDSGHGQVEPADIHGTGNVQVLGETQRGKAAALPSALAADDVTGDFAPGSVLKSITGTGHASISGVTATGAHQTAQGDHLQAAFAPHSGPASGADEIQSAVLDGHVVLVQQPATKPGAKPQPAMHATSAHAVYEGAGEWMHLTGSPRIEDGDLDIAANRIDVSQQSGDAFAHGNVKATWLNSSSGAAPAAHSAVPLQSPSLGGRAPSHAICEEVEVDRATDEATFRGHARLWQQTNSIAAPTIVLDRRKSTLVARSSDPKEPVRVVLLSGNSPSGAASHAARSGAPAVVRVRGGDLFYSDRDRRALIVSGSLGPVVAETATASSVSNQVELFLLPAHDKRQQHTGAQQPSAGQVDRLIASGHVELTSQGRRGFGDRLVYTGSNEEYVLTGTPAAPPRMTDPARGTVTGAALIFHSRDDSVSIEGGGHATRTETTVRQGSGAGPRN